MTGTGAAPTTSPFAGDRVAGVLFVPAGADSDEGEASDFQVDATGRSSRLSDRLAAWGPATTTDDADADQAQLRESPGYGANRRSATPRS